MRNKILLAGAAILLLVSASALAADITGKWVAESQGMQGPTQTVFNFKVSGNTLTGTVSARGGDTEISEGKINGDEISFVVVRTMGENEIKTLWKGKVSGDEIRFTREFQGGMGGFGGMGGPGGAGAPGGGPGAGGMGGPGGAGAPGGGRGAGGPGQELIAKRAK